MDLKALLEPLAEFKVYLLMDTLGDTIANKEVGTFSDTKAKRIENLQSSRNSLQAESLVDALSDSLAKVNVKTLGEKVVHVGAEALVDTMANRLASVQ